MTLAIDFVVAATGGNVWRRGAAKAWSGAAIDGRAVPSGGLWFAIRGEQHDGHHFAEQAVQGGATGLVVNRGRGADLDVPGEVTIVEVEDTVAALGALARAHRLSLPSLRVVGVTGSNGKTTTKELLASVLVAAAGDAAVHKTEGNFNNHLGLPLTLLRLTERHRYAVIEMGMSARGEIAYLADLAGPEVGVIVNAGPVHLETLGTVDEVARAKGELFAALPPHGAVIYPADDERLAAEARSSRAHRRLRFGAAPGVEVRVTSAHVTPDGTDVELRLPAGEQVRARLQAIGLHNARNAAAAAAAACAFDIGSTAIARGLGAAATAKHRSTVIEIGGRRVLDDCYNASPLSVPAALDALADLRGPGERAVAVLGDMLELGEQAELLHRSMGAHVAARGIDALFAIGPRASQMVLGARDGGLTESHHRDDVDSELLAEIDAATRPGDWLLVKASRGMRLERVIDGLRAFYAATQQEGGG